MMIAENLNTIELDSAVYRHILALGPRHVYRLTDHMIFVLANDNSFYIVHESDSDAVIFDLTEDISLREFLRRWSEMHEALKLLSH
jgi:hypothetical protein